MNFNIESTAKYVFFGNYIALKFVSTIGCTKFVSTIAVEV